jgi:hypothetical protein
MKMIRFLAIGFIICAFFIPGISKAQATSEKLELPWKIFIPCANDGLGEWLTGTLTLHYVTNKNCWYHHQAMGCVLVGEDTGTVYRVTGITEHTTIEAGKYINTYIDVYHFVGAGTQFLERIIYHVTIVNGETIVIVDHEQMICE